MPRNIAHRAKRELEQTVRQLRAFCATEHGYTTAESLWASFEKNKSGAVFSFDFARLLRLNPKTRHSLLRFKSRPESRAANHFKGEFFNLRCTPQHQDEDTPGFASIGQQNRRRLRRTGLLQLREESMKERSAEKMLGTWPWIENRQVCVWIVNCYISSMERIQRSRISRKIAQPFASLRFFAGCRISEDTQT